MLGKSLKENNQNLSGLALEAFIVDATSQGENYCFEELLEHPNIGTVKPRFIKILKLFTKANIADYTQFLKEEQQLTDKQILCLRKLTVLSVLRGFQTILLGVLEQSLQLSELEVIQLLLKMSIEGSILIKIDQEKGVITIYNSEIRTRAVEEQECRAAKASIELIVIKNDETSRQIERLKNEKPRKNHDY